MLLFRMSACAMICSAAEYINSVSLQGLFCCRSEVFLMMRCLRDMNMSKFVAEDVPLFLSLIDDLFPALKADRASFPEISAALEKVCPLSLGACL